MKSVLLSIFISLFLSANIAFSQIKREKYFLECKAFKEMAGEWEWKSGDSAFRVIFEYSRKKMEPPIIISDCLSGYYHFTVSNEVVSSTFEKDTAFVGKDWICGIGNDKNDFTDISISDIRSKGKSMQLNFSFIDKNTAHWKLSPDTRENLMVIIGLEKVSNIPFSLPTNIIMHRVIKE